ncbi:MAG: nicotinate-nucleotide adenylyltransferase [Pseudomonadota bacterium]|nr:nicotinate-nucleotide adenylyltransferase [Pseudomonadota bacterium]
MFHTGPSRFPQPPAASRGMTIGLLGGSFNPAHEGHLHISLEAIKRLELDRVWWLVTPGNPLKPKGGLKPLAQRLEAAQKLARHPRIEATGFEEHLPDAYTVHTLEFLVSRYPGVRFIWLMGADNMVQLHRWKDWRTIMSNVAVAVLDRPGYRLQAAASPAALTFARDRVDESDASGLWRMHPPAWTILTIPLTRASSTALRRKAA